MTMRFNVVDDEGTVSLVGPSHIMKMLAAACARGDTLVFDRCVEFAAGAALRVAAHHESVHTGNAGGSPFVMGALWDAGHR